MKSATAYALERNDLLERELSQDVLLTVYGGAEEVPDEFVIDPVMAGALILIIRYELRKWDPIPFEKFYAFCIDNNKAIAFSLGLATTVSIGIRYYKMSKNNKRTLLEYVYKFIYA